MSRYSTRKIATLALLTSAVFAISSLAPIEFAPGPFSPDAAFAKSENGRGNGNGGGNRGGNGGSKGGQKSSAKSNNGGGQGGGKGGGKGLGNGVGGLFANATAKGGNLINKVLGRDKVKTQNAHTSNGKPNAVVRQYVLESGQKQGDVAKMLKSWNSLNRNEQAYLNNMDNLNSLPGKQIEYVRSSIAATEAALAETTALDAFFETYGHSNPDDVPNNVEHTAANAALDAAELDTAYETLEDYTVAKATDSPFVENQVYEDALAAEATIAEYEAWNGTDEVDGVADLQAEAEAAEMAAQDAFMEASVSYSGEYNGYMADVREHVDAIIDLKELDMLVEDYDAAAAVAEGDTVVLLDGNGETFELVVE